MRHTPLETILLQHQHALPIMAVSFLASAKCSRITVLARHSIGLAQRHHPRYVFLVAAGFNKMRRGQIARVSGAGGHQA